MFTNKVDDFMTTLKRLNNVFKWCILCFRKERNKFEDAEANK